MIIQTLLSRRVKFQVIAGDIYVIGERMRSWNLVLDYRNRRMIEKIMTGDEKHECKEFRKEIGKYAVKEMTMPEKNECRRLRFEGKLLSQSFESTLENRHVSCTIYRPPYYDEFMDYEDEEQTNT